MDWLCLAVWQSVVRITMSAYAWLIGLRLICITPSELKWHFLLFRWRQRLLFERHTGIHLSLRFSRPLKVGFNAKTSENLSKISWRWIFRSWPLKNSRLSTWSECSIWSSRFTSSTKSRTLLSRRFSKCCPIGRTFFEGAKSSCVLEITTVSL